MHDPNGFGDLQAAWARLLLASLAEAGVRDVIISPGSRSTPLVLAAIDDPDVRCHDVVDERSAGFFALGRAKATGRPPLLVCTSGSAAAHYLPALVEARQAFAPLLVLTADRPLELAHCGANQAIDQLKLYGDQVVAFFELGLADASPDALRALRRSAVQAVAASRWPIAGGVHLNARFKKPLEPSPDAAGDTWLAALRRRPATVFEAPSLEPPRAAVTALARQLAAAERPLIVCGPLPMDRPVAAGELEAVAAATGAALFTEATSQLRFRGAAPAGACRVDAFDSLLAAAAGPVALPDLVLQLGAAPTSDAWSQHLGAAAEAGCDHVAVSADGWHDPQSTLGRQIIAAPARLVSALAGRLGSPAVPSPWVEAWQRAETVAWKQAAALVAAPAPLSEAQSLRVAAGAVPPGGLLAIGNSLPVRLLDAWVEGSQVAEGVAVLHQRGASGIDGLVSSAAGAADASRRPTLLVLGDVSLLHDIGGLAVARSVTMPFVILVLANGGGRIFDQLPIAGHPAVAGRFDHWHTPPRVDFAAAARAFGIPFTRTDDAATLRSSLEAALEGHGPCLIEAVVPPGGAAADLAALRRAVAEARG